VLRFVMGGPVTTQPELRITAKDRNGAAVVVVKVVAPGVSDPGGKVRVRIGNKKRFMRPVDGRVRVVIEGLRAKKHKVYVRYSGTDVVESRNGSTYVRIRR
jgi:hypothetical protein